ncbi:MULTISPECIES: helix-turn-helix domain-containing protein [Providencia]|uniref:Anaerobic benzoate catabolism transcriptional regulator n=1 Tax=Providencia rettgeri TaxID=587 RepID=A0A1B8SQC4_PRORE|nr:MULTISPECIES: helix-turn-helix transcriptional regulator [Providencia]AWS53072.1 XRE family transcriptional regulator [Providencia rettgeri]EHZ7764669.1 helix-turn-helix transcriptional regulator [Providencia rettgeri]EIJ7167811.1 helix-turn-helix transcriptional regulator [Providencia rettgeri]EJD6046913.1 helix-turn-helix transcriptional regulator [Providencia rettgeri]EJD6378531.1 helix-turn-helix transcriptional regulator [Providencia rettgeri]
MNTKYPVACAVGQKIKALRRAQGFTVFQLAKEIDISEQQLFRYERGVNRIDIDCLVRVLKVLDVNMGEFFSEVLQDDTQVDESTGDKGFESSAYTLV